MSVALHGARCGTRNVLLDALLRHAHAAPDAPALHTGSGAVSYAELVAALQNEAAMLAAAGVEPDDVVAFAASRAPGAYTRLLAILACGAAYLPLDAAQAPARIDGMLQDAQPKLLVASHALHARLGWDGNWLDSAVSASAFHADVKPSGRLAYVLFTSGSTGRPKGVAMGTAAIVRLIAWQRRHARLGRAARTLQFAPLGFDVSFQEILSTLATGGTLIVPSDAERRDPWALLELLGRERVERLFLPFVALSALAEAALDRPGSPALALRDVITAGEQLRITPALRAFFGSLPGCVLHNHYGPTETHVVTTHELEGDPATWPELPPIGRPLPHARVRIEQSGNRGAEGAGELLIGGACLADGYIGHPDLTAHGFVELDGARWYRSGDRVRTDAAGRLEYLGRLDDQVKVAGQRIEPAEVEAVLSRHAQVRAAVVVAQAAADGVRLVAHVVAREGSGGDDTLRRQLARHCAALLPEAMRPQSFVLHQALPVTASGKVDRRALRDGQPRSAPAWQRHATVSQQLLALWRHLLERDDLDVNSNLFDAGARSLTVVHALTELRRHGLVMSVARVYELPTVAAQAAHLGGADVAAAGADTARQRGALQRAALSRLAGMRAAAARTAQTGAGS